MPNDRTAHPPGIAPTRRCSSVALTSGVDVRRLDLLYLLTLSLTVALGLRYLGVLLMGSLLIIPPAAARVLARNLKEMLVLSAAIAIVSTVSGSYIAALTGRARPDDRDYCRLDFLRDIDQGTGDGQRVLQR